MFSILFNIINNDTNNWMFNLLAIAFITRGNFFSRKELLLKIVNIGALKQKIKIHKA